MKINLAGVLRDVQLTTLAVAIALGWSLYQTALGVAAFVEDVTVNTRGLGQGFTGLALYPQEGLDLTWTWGHHLFSFGLLVLGLIELGTVLAAALLIRRFSRRA